MADAAPPPPPPDREAPAAAHAADAPQQDPADQRGGPGGGRGGRGRGGWRGGWRGQGQGQWRGRSRGDGDGAGDGDGEAEGGEGGRGGRGGWRGRGRGGPPPFAGRQPGVVPNAVVIKGIPLDMTPEELQAELAKLNLTPTALDFHKATDGGFNGTAFANFSGREDATRALAELPAREVRGAKLRVEPKLRHQRSCDVFTGRVPFADPRLSEEENARQNSEFRQMLQAFVDDPDATVLEFPPTLNARARLKVHHMVEEFGNLHHRSEGEEPNRRLIVTKAGAAPAPPAQGSPAQRPERLHFATSGLPPAKVERMPLAPDGTTAGFGAHAAGDAEGDPADATVAAPAAAADEAAAA